MFEVETCTILRSSFAEEDTHGTLYGNGIVVFACIMNIDNRQFKFGISQFH